MGEVGQIAALTHNPVEVVLGRSYQNPVVFVQPVSYNGPGTSVVRITDVQPDRFTAYIHEPPNLDVWHTAETVSYLVVEAGSWRLAGGTLLQVGSEVTSATVLNSLPGLLLGRGRALPDRFCLGSPTIRTCAVSGTCSSSA
jgi:hypothetical protein